MAEAASAMSRAAASTRGSPLRLAATAAFVAIGALTFGVDSGGLSGFIAMPAFQKEFGVYDPHLKAWAIPAHRQLEFNVFALIASVMGSFASGPIGNILGRRAGLALTALSGILGAAISLAATNYKTLICGKVFTGLVYGLANVYIPMYCSEVAPARWRGVMVATYQCGICIGNIIAASINYATYQLETTWAWRGPFTAQLILPTILFFGIWLFPESPRWYLLKGKRAQAHKAIRKLSSTAYSDAAIEEELDYMEAAIKEEEEQTKGRSALELFRGTNRRRTVLALTIVFFQSYSGPSFITSYGTYFLQVSGVGNAFLVAIVLQAMGFLGCACCFPAVSRFSRRNLMIYGGIIQFASMFTFAIVGVAIPGTLAAGKVLAAFTIIYYFFSNLTWSPLAWIIASELPSTSMRSMTLGIVSAWNWTLTLTGAVWLPYALNPDIGNLGAKTGFIFGGVQLIGTIWMFFYQPETSNRTLEELDELFFREVPSRKFATFELNLPQSALGNGTPEQTEDKDTRALEEYHP